LFNADLLRSSFFIILVAGFMVVYKEICSKHCYRNRGLLMVSDLFFVAKIMFLGKICEQVSSRSTFQETPSDAEILKDTSNYRVFEVGDIMGARASYFHKSGGYSAVRPRGCRY
jgi:hypothetical protein